MAIKNANERTHQQKSNPPKQRKLKRLFPLFPLPLRYSPTNPSDSDEIRVGSEVAYHLPKAKQSDAEWIQCNVVRITGDPPKQRYEVQDPEPDENGNMSQPYKTYASNLILIPEESSGLPPLPTGTMVLARYPETTTFYRAEVITTKVLPRRKGYLGSVMGLVS